MWISLRNLDIFGGQQKLTKKNKRVIIKETATYRERQPEREYIFKENDKKMNEESK